MDSKYYVLSNSTVNYSWTVLAYSAADMEKAKNMLDSIL